jgi:uracil-DNA glycosylase family 4
MSLQLDQRRRAMLAEMGVHLPEAAVTVSEEVSVEMQVGANADITSVPPVSPRPITQVAGAGGMTSSSNRTGSDTAQSGSTGLQRGAPAPRPLTGSVADMSWSALQQAVASCEACNLCQQRRNTVFGTGAPEPTPGEAPQVDWMIVGEAPGENEDLQGEPFVGQAGRLLDNMLKAVGLERHAAQAPGGRVYIANVLKCRPPGNRNPHPDEVARCEPYLRRQVALLRPRIIVAMGRFAVQSLLRDSVGDIDTQPLGRLRGQVYAYEGVPVVVTYHPAYLLRNLIEKRKAWADLCLALSVANRPQG